MVGPPPSGPVDCIDCHYYDPAARAKPGEGLCRRFPKVEIMKDLDWCGEWLQK